MKKRRRQENYTRARVSLSICDLEDEDVQDGIYFFFSIIIIDTIDITLSDPHFPIFTTLSRTLESFWCYIQSIRKYISNSDERVYIYIYQKRKKIILEKTPNCSVKWKTSTVEHKSNGIYIQTRKKKSLS